MAAPNYSTSTPVVPTRGLLDAEYFEPLPLQSSDDDDKDVELLAFGLKHPALVLCNAITGQALLSVIPVAHNDYVPQPDKQQPRTASLADLALLPRGLDADGEQRFHALVGKDHQFCEFVVTNLTGVLNRPRDHAPFINFNLLHAGSGRANDQVNEANVFAPGQSIKIYADKARGSQKIVLQGLTRTITDPITQEQVTRDLTVAEDEAEVQAGKKASAEGVHYSLSVLPELGHKRTDELFGAGVTLVWRVQDLVLLAVPRLTPKSPIQPGGFGFGLFHPAAPRTGGFGATPPATSPTGGFGAFGAFGAPATASSSASSLGHPAAPRTVGIGAFGAFPPPALPSATGFGFDGFSPFGHAPTTTNHVSGQPVTINRHQQQFLLGSSVVAPQQETSILESQAAKVVAGGFAKVSTTLVAQEFNPELRAPVCILSLSVAVAKQIDKPERWLLKSSNEPSDALLRCKGGAPFQQAIACAYGKWFTSRTFGNGFGAPSAPISSEPSGQRLFRWCDLESNTCIMIDFQTMSGTHAPTYKSPDSPGGYRIDPAELVFLEIRREAPSRPWVGGIMPGFRAVRSRDECLQAARDACKTYRAKELGDKMRNMPNFKSAECAVCGDANPTVVVALCGHQCYCTSPDCYDNPLLRKPSGFGGFGFGGGDDSPKASIELCPICRQTVSGKVSMA